MIYYKEAVAPATAALWHVVAPDEQLQSMDRYVATAARSLRASENNDREKCEFLRKLVVCAALSCDRAQKYVDWSIIAPDRWSE